jgi:hypothetical protein
MVPVRTAGNAVDRDPLLVLDVAEGQARLVVVGLEVAPAVALDPVQAEIVGLGQVDGAALGQPALPERVEGQRDQAVRQSRKPLTNPSTPSRPRGILGDGAAEQDLTRNGDGLKEPRCTSGSSAARVASSPAGSTNYRHEVEGIGIQRSNDVDVLPRQRPAIRAHAGRTQRRALLGHASSASPGRS